MNEDLRKIPTFVKPLQRSEFNRPEQPTKLYEFSSDPRFVVREWSMDYVRDKGFSTMQEFASITKRVFDELRSYGVLVPVQFVIARDETNTEKMYIITDNITKAENISTTENTRRDKVMTQFLKRLLKYYQDKYRSGEQFLFDILSDSNEQYVYGKNAGDKYNQMYLVDTDPYFTNDKNRLVRVLEALVDGMKGMQEYQKMPLTRAVASCEKTIRQLRSEGYTGDDQLIHKLS